MGEHVKPWGPAVILSDGDVVFQPRKVERSGLFEAVDGHVLIYVHKEQEGEYYDTMGALRDMVPSHLFQLITLTAMEPPIGFEADTVRDEQTKVLRALQPFTPEEVLARTARGQYSEGTMGGEPVSAYRAEARGAPASSMETFVAHKLLLDNWHWAGVPFYLRTGKWLPTRVTDVAIQFKRAPFMPFRQMAVEHLTPNRRVLHLQPQEGISLRFGAKVPDPQVRLGPVNMEFRYADSFGTTPNTGYEQLLYNGMMGDATLFQRADMIEAAWAVVAPILDVRKALPPRHFPNYAAGTWGPKAADELIGRDGRQ